jgi:hypothetical protein
MKMIESGYNKCVYQEIVIMDLLQGHSFGAFNTDKPAKNTIGKAESSRSRHSNPEE